MAAHGSTGRTPPTTPATTPATTPSRPTAEVSRRAVLAGLIAPTALVAGCGLRLDLPQPAPPVPTRQRVPDEVLLIDVVRDLRRLLTLVGQLPVAARRGATVRDALRILGEQDRVLTGRLTNGGVPTALIDAPPPGPTETGSPGSDASASPTSFATALAHLPTGRWEALATASPAGRLVLWSATSARLAAAVRLGEAVALELGAPQALQRALEDHTAPLVYGFEVVAAQSAGSARQTARETLDGLRRLLAAVATGLPGSDVLPGGWSLPYPVATPQAAARLATDLLARAIAAAAGLLPAAPSRTDLAEVGTWSARVQALGPAHGIPLTAFPGTSGTARP